MLAGGRGSRLGGRDKGEIRIGGDRLVDIVVDAALAVGCEDAVVAGEPISGRASNVLEEPRFGGPVAGLAAALSESTGGWILLLACDLPHASDLCQLISSAAGETAPKADGLVVTAAGQRQWLAGLYRRSAIEAGLARMIDPHGTSLRDLMSEMDLHEVEDPAGFSRDIDTPEDLGAASNGKEYR